MTRPKSVKAARSLIVGVIASAADLRRATRLRQLPDAFELRLDLLGGVSLNLEAGFAQLARPLIITARHPAEGGAGGLSTASRRELLRQFLPIANYIDVELRSARFMGDIFEQAAAAKIARILSFHDFRKTLAAGELLRQVEQAKNLRAEICKIATRVDTRADLDRLLDFFDRAHEQLPLAVMGIGELGRESRRELALRGSALNYAHLGTAHTPGQLSVGELRAIASRKALARTAA